MSSISAADSSQGEEKQQHVAAGVSNDAEGNNNMLETEVDDEEANADEEVSDEEVMFIDDSGNNNEVDTRTLHDFTLDKTTMGPNSPTGTRTRARTSDIWINPQSQRGPRRFTTLCGQDPHLYPLLHPAQAL